DGVPLCAGPEGVGNSLVDDVLQCHTALTPGRPGTSWHRSHRGSYMSSPPGTITGLVHGAGSPLISRWVRVAGAPQRAQVAFSHVHLMARRMSRCIPGKDSPRKSLSRPATCTSCHRDSSSISGTSVSSKN